MCIRDRYIHNYITNEVTELEELMEIKQLIQRQKLERMMKVHKEMRGLDRYREQPKEYKSVSYTHLDVYKRQVL